MSDNVYTQEIEKLREQFAAQKEQNERMAAENAQLKAALNVSASLPNTMADDTTGEGSAHVATVGKRQRTRESDANRQRLSSPWDWQLGRFSDPAASSSSCCNASVPASTKGLEDVVDSNTANERASELEGELVTWLNNRPNDRIALDRLTRLQKKGLIAIVRRNNDVPGRLPLNKAESIRKWFNNYVHDDDRSEFLTDYLITRFEDCFPADVNIQVTELTNSQIHASLQAQMNEKMIVSVKEFVKRWNTSNVISKNGAIPIHGEKYGELLNGIDSLFCRTCYFEVAEMMFHCYLRKGVDLEDNDMQSKARSALQLLGFDATRPPATATQGYYVNIFGDVGVGKSCLLWFILAVCITVGIPVKILGALAASGMRGSCKVNSDGSVVGVKNVTDENKWIYLADHNPPFELPEKIVKLYVTSSSDKRTKHWKHLAPRVHVMPAWSEEELKAACELCQNSLPSWEKVREIFQICGGVARVCFNNANKGMGEQNPSYAEEVIGDIEAQARSVANLQKLEDILKIGYADRDEEKNTHQIFHVVPNKCPDSTSLFSRYYGGTVPASKKVGSILYHHLLRCQDYNRVKLYKMLRQIPHARALAGRLFEPMAHAALLSKRGGKLSTVGGKIEYTIQYLKKPGEKGKSPSNQYFIPHDCDIQAVEFKNVRELNTTAENSLDSEDKYFISTDGSFGAIENFHLSRCNKFHIEGMQMTESMNHGVKGEILNEFRRQILPLLHNQRRCMTVRTPEDLKIRLLFVVPPENYDADFTHQSYTDIGGNELQNVFQYALRLDTEEAFPVKQGPIG